MRPSLPISKSKNQETKRENCKAPLKLEVLGKHVAVSYLDASLEWETMEDPVYGNPMYKGENNLTSLNTKNTNDNPCSHPPTKINK